MRSGVLVALTLFLVAAPARAATLWLDVAPAQCSERVQTAVRSRLPGVDLRVGTNPDPGDVAASISQNDGGWALIAHGDSALAGLQRPLPAPGEDCVDLAETAALMLARYLEEIHWGGSTVEIEPFTRPAPELPPLPPVPIHIVIGLGPSLEHGLVAVLPGLQLEVALRRGSIQAGVSVAGLLPEQDPVSSSDPGVGQYRLQNLRLEAVGGGRFQVGPGLVVADLGVGAMALWVDAKGGLLFQETPAFAAIPLIGARAGYEIPLPWDLAVAIRGAGRVLLGSAAFEVTGYAGGIATHRLDGDLSLVLSRTFF